MAYNEMGELSVGGQAGGFHSGPGITVIDRHVTPFQERSSIGWWGLIQSRECLVLSTLSLVCVREKVIICD